MLQPQLRLVRLVTEICSNVIFIFSLSRYRKRRTSPIIPSPQGGMLKRGLNISSI